MNAPLPKLYTMDEAAIFFGVRACTVRNEIRRGKLGYISIGGRGIRLTHDHLIQYVTTREVEAGATATEIQPEAIASASAPASQRRQGSTSQGITNPDVRHAVSALARQTFARRPKRSRTGLQNGTTEKKHDRAA
jgi:hypothetical protein